MGPQKENSYPAASNKNVRFGPLQILFREPVTMNALASRCM